MSESRGFVQGVAWNPRHPLLATLSSDRSLRLYSSASKKLTAKVHKANLALASLRPPPSSRRKQGAASEAGGAGAATAATEGTTAEEPVATEAATPENRNGRRILPINVLNFILGLIQCQNLGSLFGLC